MFTLTCIGSPSSFPFWTLSTVLLTETSAAVALAFISSIGNLGNFVGPLLVGVLSQTNRYSLPLFGLTSAALVSSGLVFLVRSPKLAD
jgi:ACS family tartrate transporter-like MFS transporter